MNRIILAISSMFSGLLAFGQGDSKYDEIMELPVLLEVTHSPNPAKAQRGGPSGSEFTWIYETKVSSKEKTLTVVEFGAFAWHRGRWLFSNYTGEPFTSKDFEDWYSCPGAVLEAGKAYSDQRNWSGANLLRHKKAKWYFVARDESGNLYRGTGVIEEIDEIR